MTPGAFCALLNTMNVLIIYHSRTGRTRELANEIAEGAARADAAEAIVRSADEVTRDEFVAADAVIAGSPVYFGTMTAELKSVFDKFVGTRRKMEGKVGAAFATSGHHTGGKETTMMSIIQAFLIYGMIIVGDPLDTGGHYGIGFSGEMTDELRDQAVRFGERVARIAAAVASSRSQSAS